MRTSGKDIHIQHVKMLNRSFVSQLVYMVGKHNDRRTLSHQYVLGRYAMPYFFPGAFYGKADRHSSRVLPMVYVERYIRARVPGRYHLWVAVDCRTGTLAGASGCIIRGTCYGHSWTVVHRNYRKRGIATRLMDEKEKYTRGRTDVRYLTFVTSNDDMHEIAVRRGYTLSGTVRGRRNREMDIYVKDIKEVYNHGERERRY